MAHGILVPIDGSTLAAAAIPYALALATRFEAPLTLAHVVDTATRGRETAAEARQRGWAEAEARLAALRAEAAAHGPSVAVALEEGAPAPALLDIARAREASLIVMATHGRTGPSRWVLGSVAEHLLRLTHLPTLLLTPRALDAGEPYRLGQRVLVPIDGSAVSERILPIVTALAAVLQIPLTLAQVVDPVQIASLGAADPTGSAAALWPDLLTSYEDQARAQLEDHAARLRAAGLDVEVVVEVGSTVGALSALATRAQAGWVAMASHGRGGLGGLVLGSTALAVLRHTLLPVLLAAAPTADQYRLGASSGHTEAPTM